MPCSQALLSGEPRLSVNLADIAWAGKHKGNILDAKFKVIAILVFSRKIWKIYVYGNSTLRFENDSELNLMWNLLEHL